MNGYMDTSGQRRFRCEEIEQRYPRLVRAIQWTAILCTAEAACTIRAHLEDPLDPHNSLSSCEAVAHWCGGGSVKELLERAIKTRQWSNLAWMPKAAWSVQEA